MYEGLPRQILWLIITRLYMFLLFIGKFVLCYISMFCFRTVGLRISGALRLAYLKALFAQPVAKLDLISAGAVSNTITDSANTIQVSISDRMAYLFQALALIIAAYAIAFSYSWRITLVASSALVFILAVYSFTTPIAIRGQQRLDKANEKHASIAGEIFSSIRTVFSLGAERSLTDKYLYWINESERLGMRLAPLWGIQISPMFFAMYSTFALSFWAGLKFYYEGSVPNVNSVIIAFFSVLIVVSVLSNIVTPIMNITKAVSSSASFFSMMDAERVDDRGLRGPEVTAQADISLNNVTFAYPSRPDVQVLRDFSATFQQGKTTALVGPSGSGKSTIVGLLERWYALPISDHPNAEGADVKTPSALASNSGSVTCGPHNVNALELRWWRTQIGLVQQEPFLFNDTILANVSFGLLGTEWESRPASEKLELVKQACKDAFADEFIDKLPQGYETVVGEAGVRLSGGQKSRIAIARAVIKAPNVLVLDEATAAIDVRSEAVVQKALDNISKGRTTIVIAHRLATIRKADHIIVLRNGAKVEEGSHDGLLKDENGLYSGLIRAQQIQESAHGANVPEDVFSELVRRQSTAVRSSMQETTKENGTCEYKKRGFFGTVGVTVYEQRSKWIFVVIVIIGAMGAGSAFALQAWFFAKLITVFTYVGQQLLDARDKWSLMFFILAIANVFTYGGLAYASAVLLASTKSASRKDYFSNLIRQPIPYFDQEDNASGSVMSRLSTDPTNVGEVLGLSGAFPLISIFNLVACTIISFYFGWKLTLVVLFAAMPLLLICQAIKIRNEFEFEKMNSKIFAESSAFAVEAVGAFRTVSSLTMEETIISKYTKMLEDQVKAYTRRATYAMLLNAFCDSVELAAMALTFWYGGQLLARREYVTEQFFVVYVAIIQGSIAAGQFLSAATNIANSTASANRIFAMRSLNLEPTMSLGRSALAAVPTTSTIGAKIDISHISHQYPNRGTPTFRNLSVSIPAGSFAAFVGPSGCGKTTVISLLERFYKPCSGTISLNDIPIDTIPLANYRSDISLVAQEPRLFSGTLRENLLLGCPDPSSVTDEILYQACRDAEIHDFILSLPNGYDTDLGASTSTNLSGGQKQRVALARALLRKPRLLLLDESTSSLDSQSEKLVQQAIERLAGQKEMTVIAVAHRLATIQKADIIFVFGESEVGDGARILERGSHGELMRRRGAYWQMCQAQALDR